MKLLLKQKNKILAVIMLLFVLVSAFAPLVSQAADTPPTDTSFTIPQFSIAPCGSDFGCLFTRALQNVLLMLVGMLGKLFTTLFSWFTSGMIYMLNFGTTITKMSIVKAGFAATLSLANLLFVLAILVMAFATIFQWEEYSAKRLLKALIISAVLVNFSFLIAGLILDASNVITNEFLNGFDKSKIGAYFQPQRLIALTNGLSFKDTGAFSSAPLNTTSTEAGEWYKQYKDADGVTQLEFGLNPHDSGWGFWARILVSTLIAVIMMFLLALVMITLTIATLTRNITIAVLLIFMPVIWACRLFPFLSEHWGNWWKKFIENAVFLPTVTFTLWLTFTTVQNLDVLNSEAGITGAGQPWMSTILGLLILIGLLYGGLKVSKKAGIIGAALGFGVAGFIAGKIKGGAVGLGRGVAGAPVMGLGRGVQTAGKSALFKGKYNPLRFLGAGALVRGAGGLAITGGKNIAGTGKIGNAVTGAITKGSLEKNLGAANQYASDHMKDWQNDQFLAEFNHPHDNSTTAQLALLQKLNDKKLLGDAAKNSTRLAELIQTAQKVGAKDLANSTAREALNKNPMLALDADQRVRALFMGENQTIADVIRKISTSKIVDVGASALENPEVVAALTKEQAAALHSNGSPAQQLALMTELRRQAGGDQMIAALRTIETDLSDLVKNKKLADAVGDQARSAALQASITTKTNERDQARIPVQAVMHNLSAYEKLNRIEQTPGKI